MSLEKSISEEAGKAIEEAKKELSQALGAKKAAILEELDKYKQKIMEKARQ
ncbi:hypothetical protein GCM10007981_16570 [Thermocladium modestius]|uniref:Uncharacterized protein n=1 Tax=Thermocladium modestius TaxID=62609 RepID=A0A830GY47_9CREN|nr:hypothetical protein [Thermocladium modestius]GGP22023.1 hypothetical protein GCM10007981_16570 [Thermocladium modestius]